MIEQSASPQTSIAGLKGMGGKKGKGSLKAGLFAKFLALFQKHMAKNSLPKGAQHAQTAQAVQKSKVLQKGVMGKQAATVVEPGSGLALMVHAPGLKGGEIKFSSMEGLQAWLQEHPDAVVMMEPEVGSDASVAEAFMAAMQEIDGEDAGEGLADDASVVRESVPRDSSADILVGLSLVGREKVGDVMLPKGGQGAAEDAQMDVLGAGKQKKSQGEKGQLQGQAQEQDRQQRVPSSMPVGKEGVQVAADGKIQQLTAKASGLLSESARSLASAASHQKSINQQESTHQKPIVQKQDAVKTSAVEILLQSQRAEGESVARVKATVGKANPAMTTKLDAMSQFLVATDADSASIEERVDVDAKAVKKTVQQAGVAESLKAHRSADDAADIPKNLAQFRADRNTAQPQLQAAPVSSVDRAVATVATGQDLGSGQQDLGSSQQEASQLLAEHSKADNKAQRAADFAAQLAYKTSKAFKPGDAMLEIARSARDGSVKIELQLDPAHLGKIQVTLQTDAAKQLQVHFVVDQAMSRQALEQNMPQLRQALADQGLDLGSFSMSMNSQGQGNDSQGSGSSGSSEGRGNQAVSMLQESQNQSQEIRMGVNLAGDGGLSVLV